MPSAIDPIIKQRVISQYLRGVSRHTIAADNNIGTGTVSNIIDDFKKGAQDSDYESIRDLMLSDLMSIGCSPSIFVAVLLEPYI